MNHYYSDSDIEEFIDDRSGSLDDITPEQRDVLVAEIKAEAAKRAAARDDERKRWDEQVEASRHQREMEKAMTLEAGHRRNATLKYAEYAATLAGVLGFIAILMFGIYSITSEGEETKRLQLNAEIDVCRESDDVNACLSQLRGGQ